MKHAEDLYVAELDELCRESDLLLNEADLRALVRFAGAVDVANTRLNLTRISGMEDALRLHVLDSLLALPEVEAAEEGPLLDLGTGAGYPGVPLAVAAKRRAVLLDSVTKKADAVREVVEEAGLGGQIRVEAERAEALALSEGPVFPVVTARAVAQLPSLVELAAPLMAKGGVLVALKGNPTGDELDRGRAAASLCGLRELSVRRVALPQGGEARTIVTYERVAEPTIKLPRRIGMAQHSPLA